MAHLSLDLKEADHGYRMFMHNTVHRGLTFVLLWFAYIFMDGLPTFGDNLPGYAGLASLMTERHWGQFCLLFGLCGLFTLGTKNWTIRTTAAALMSFAHGFIAYRFYLGSPHGTAAGAYLGYAYLAGSLAYSTAYLGARSKAGVGATSST